MNAVVVCCVHSDVEPLVSSCLPPGLVLAVMAPRLCVCTRSDMLWRRVCWKLLENIPQRWMESVLVGLVQTVSGLVGQARLTTWIQKINISSTHLLHLFLLLCVFLFTYCLFCFRPDALGRIIGNLVLTNKKAQFVITHKLLLLQYKYEVIQ